MKRTYARFYAILNFMQAPDKEELKAELVRQYTDGRTTSIREMSDREYDAMCDSLQQQSNSYKSREIAREELRRSRSAALHLMQKKGIDTTDWDHVNAFCKNPRIAGKEFGKLTTDELDLLCIKLRIIRRKENQKYTLLN